MLHLPTPYHEAHEDQIRPISDVIKRWRSESRHSEIRQPVGLSSRHRKTIEQSKNQQNMPEDNGDQRCCIGVSYLENTLTPEEIAIPFPLTESGKTSAETTVTTRRISKEDRRWSRV